MVFKKKGISQRKKPTKSSKIPKRMFLSPKTKKHKTKNKIKKTKETIFVFGAHSDDFVIGAGGTIAKYSQTGKKVFSFVFSYGEKSHPWLKTEIAQKMRAQEAKQASKILNCSLFFFDLEEFHFLRDYHQKQLEKKLLQLIQKHRPLKIFTHSPDDPHPDHLAVYKITLALWEKIPPPQPEIFVYSIWNPLSIKTTYPLLYEDITRTFSLKIRALKTFRSQKIAAFYPSLLMFYRAIRNGLKIKKRFAERFYRLK